MVVDWECPELQVHKCKMSKQPTYMHKRLFPDENVQVDGRRMRSDTNEHINIPSDLSLSRASFFYRGSKLYNNLPMHIKEITSLPRFKSNVKAWIKRNVSLRP